MDYRSLFDRAMSQKLSGYTFSDNRTIMKNIEERAIRMENNKARRHSVFSAVAGTAAAVAVIGGSALGLNYLNEHGGLKEGGSGSSQNSGAGYHDTVQQEAPKDIMDIEGDVVQFDDMTATIYRVRYDGHYLRVLYHIDRFDADFYRNDPDKAQLWLHETLELPDTEGIPSGRYYRSGGTCVCSREDRLYCTTLLIELKEGERRTNIEFAHDVRYDGTDPDTRDTQYAGVYTLSAADADKTSYTMETFTVPFKTGAGDEFTGTAVIDSLTLTPLGAYMFTKEGRVVCDSDFSVRFRDGSVTTLIDCNDGVDLKAAEDGRLVERSAGGLIFNGPVAGPLECSGLSENIEEGEYRINIYSMVNDIDVNDIAAVIINGSEIPLNFCAGMEFEKAAELISDFESKGTEFRYMSEWNTEIPAGWVIRTEPEFGLLEGAPESCDIYLSAGDPEENNFNLAYRSVGEPSGIPELINFGWDGRRTYIYISRYSFDNFLTEVSADVAADESFFAAISEYCDENGALNYDKVSDDLDAFQIIDFLDNNCISGVRYFRLNDKYVLGARPEDESAFVLVDAEIGAPELYGVHTDYNGIRRIIDLLRREYSGFPYITVTVVEELETGDVTLEISVLEDRMLPTVKQYLTDNGADLSLCSFFRLLVF